jgi:hypothetical protein
MLGIVQNPSWTPESTMPSDFVAQNRDRFAIILVNSAREWVEDVADSPAVDDLTGDSLVQPDTSNIGLAIEGGACGDGQVQVYFMLSNE